MTENTMWRKTLHDQFGQYCRSGVLYIMKKPITEFNHLWRAFGRVIAGRREAQTTERDEFIYHEMMTHTLLAHGHARRTF